MVGPIITGRLLDNTCQVWRESCTGGTLSCWLYNTDLMSTSAYVGVAVTKVLSITFCLLALWLYRPPQGSQPLALQSAAATESEERAGLRPVDS